MMATLSQNTQAILLLTAPLIVGNGKASPELLSPGEYKRLAKHLVALQKTPADLLSTDAQEVIQACNPIITADRLMRLLERGFLLTQAVERWRTRAIWVVSRADPDYPRRLKTRLREDAPAVIYGCGELHLADAEGLAVVGSRHRPRQVKRWSPAGQRASIRRPCVALWRLAVRSSACWPIIWSRRP